MHKTIVTPAHSSMYLLKLTMNKVPHESCIYVSMAGPVCVCVFCMCANILATFL